MTRLDDDQGKPMATDESLRLLIVEDVPSDAELAEREIKKAGIAYVSCRVENKEDFLRALKEFTPDLILSDYKLPSFDGMMALQLTLSHCPTVPFIVFTGSMNEDTAVECMKAGAIDYVIKEHITRLGMAVKSALEQKTIRGEKQRAEQALRESEERYRLLAENAQDLIYRLRIRPVRKFEYVSPASIRLIGYTPEEFYQDPDLIQRIVHQEDKRFLNDIQVGKRSFDNPLVQRWQRRDGSTVWVEQRSVPIFDSQDTIIAIEGIARDISARKEVEHQLEHSQEMLRQLSSHLQSVIEEERSSIAREIHDELGQALTALKMDIAWLNPKREPEAVEEKRRSMTDLLDQTIKTVQRITADLRPGVLDDFGLAAAVEWQVEEFRKRSGMPCELLIGALRTVPSRDSQTAMFRILQEALTNVLRHAAASKVRVRLTEEPGMLNLLVSDNGSGVPEEVRRSTTSYGLMGMMERTRALHGDFEIITGHNEGTTIIARLPIAKGEPNHDQGADRR